MLLFGSLSEPQILSLERSQPTDSLPPSVVSNLLTQVLLDFGAPKCTIRVCMTCKLTMKLLSREQAKEVTKRQETEEFTPQAKEGGAFGRALAAFENEFGTFEQLEDEFGSLLADEKSGSCGESSMIESPQGALSNSIH